MDSLRKRSSTVRYASNILILGTCIGTLFYVSSYSGSASIIGFGERSSKCEFVPPDDKVLVDFKQIMKSPVALDQDDHKLIKIIQDKYLKPPSTLPYNLKTKKDDPSMGQSEKIREILGNKENGFFVECGVLDGETRSNTLGFEKLKGWKGIIIEGDPKNFNLVMEKHRKAIAVPACLSIFPYPNTVMFRQSFNLGKISHKEPGETVAGHTEVQCLPIYSILLAANVTTIDYFSLDVEGHELEVLRTIPWEKVNIKTLSVEFVHGIEGKHVLKDYMLKKGYVVHSEVTNPAGLANDFIFARKDILPT